MIDEPACAELGIAANVAVYPDQYGMPEAPSGGPVDTTDPKTAFLDRVGEPASDGPVLLDRDCRVALCGEALQKTSCDETRAIPPRQPVRRQDPSRIS
jgi:hypothetical protein